ncbi:Imm1 family immunity protein [Saccharopolyspora spinosa]|uniref:Immunity protein Imm1 of predicted polymorphic toxin system n=1 Tax=Saccharopolyspora spinosa TaxID=60894 RepID=A0A2N3XTX9_SACSN|nr:Imm1 family immunity protein [Saccharopolyspora spinosa]PKW14143.1 immunity protein Imm1 of predicted polymorphic toxin system [Saccharopolyspora spinosa]
MTIEQTQTVVTAVFHHIFRYARTADEITELTRVIVEQPPEPVCEVYVWDRPCRSFREEDGPAFPGTGRLRVTSNPASGWAALNYMHPGSPDGALVDSLNPDFTEDTPALLFDPEGDLWFPASASLPLEKVREAVAEYCRTGARPMCVQWQPGEWY